jgi:hypothetical protein
MKLKRLKQQLNNMDTLDFTSIDTIKGIVFTTLDFYEQFNHNIDSDKELTFDFENILDSKTSTKNIGVKVIFKWNTSNTFSWNEDHKPFSRNEMRIFSNDRLPSIIEDISSILNDIDAVVL